MYKNCVINILLLFALFSSTSAYPARPKQFPTTTAWDEIHQTIHTYPLAVDSKRASLFSSVFAPDAFANYTGPISNLTGLNEITTSLLASVASFQTQHQLGTTVIDITSETTANATTYVTPTLFGTGSNAGRYVEVYGQYFDRLVRLDVGWRVVERFLVYMGPPTGDVSLLG